MSRTGVGLLFCFLASTMICASAQNFILKPLSRAEIQSVNASLDKALLPDGAGKIQVAATQSFHVQIAGRTDLTLIPVQFSISEPSIVPGMNHDIDECGVYLVDASGKSRFSQVGDSENAGLIQCSGVEGVGLAHSASSHPQVILIFNAHTVHRSWSDPYLVSWSDNDGRYVAETLPAPAWATPSDKLTIAQARKWVDGRR